MTEPLPRLSTLEALPGFRYTRTPSDFYLHRPASPSLHDGWQAFLPAAARIVDSQRAGYCPVYFDRNRDWMIRLQAKDMALRSNAAAGRVGL